MALAAGVVIFNAVLSGIVCSSSCVPFRENKNNLNTALIGHSVLEKIDTKHHDCARLCMFMSICKSIDFDRNQNTCKLNDVDRSSVDPSEFKTKMGSIYSEISEWPSEMVSGCSSRPCKMNQRCHPNGASFTCRDITCDIGQKIANGQILVKTGEYRFLDTAW